MQINFLFEKGYKKLLSRLHYTCSTNKTAVGDKTWPLPASVTYCVVGRAQVIFVGPGGGVIGRGRFIDITVTTTREHASFKLPGLIVCVVRL